MYSAIQNKFAEALASKALSFTPSTEIRKTLDNSVEAIYTHAPSLSQKPSNAALKTGESQPSPWLPPDEALLVKKLEHHSVVLNKFAVAKYHFLLVTNEFKDQSLPLGELDFEAAFNLLREVNRESGKRHIGFFNCGSQSGASVKHRHIQFMTLPDNFHPFPDTTPEVKLEGCTGDKRVPFSHFIAGIAKDASAEDVTFRYSEVLGRTLTTISKENQEAQRPEINYNLVFTEEWIMATPRKHESSESGISINALGTIGLALAKSDEQLHKLEEQGLEIIAEVGYPFEEVTEYAPDHVGFTRY